MEEKERYELQEVFEDGSFYWCLKDNNSKLLKPLVNLYNCVDLLNQQSKRIKELEETLERARQREVIIHQNYRQGYIKYLQEINELQEENQQLNEHIKELELLLKADKKIETNSLNGFEKLRQENKQLKQSQNKKAIEELERVQVQCQFDITFADYEQEQRLYDFINNQIKELKGEE